MNELFSVEHVCETDIEIEVLIDIFVNRQIQEESTTQIAYYPCKKTFLQDINGQ